MLTGVPARVRPRLGVDDGFRGLGVSARTLSGIGGKSSRWAKRARMDMQVKRASLGANDLSLVGTNREREREREREQFYVVIFTTIYDLAATL
jgi:hypothetical protein